VANVLLKETIQRVELRVTESLFDQYVGHVFNMLLNVTDIHRLRLRELSCHCSWYDVTFNHVHFTFWYLHFPTTVHI